MPCEVNWKLEADMLKSLERDIERSAERHREFGQNEQDKIGGLLRKAYEAGLNDGYVLGRVSE